MSVSGTTGVQLQIEVDGAPVDENPLVSAALVSAEVDTSLFMPSQFRLIFRGSREDVLLGGGFQLGALVDLQVTTGSGPTPLMTMAEVTAVEVEYSSDGNLTIVRGMDASHKLMHGTKLMPYPEMTASDVVSALVLEAGIEKGQIMPTSTTYPWLTQANISSWVFIQQLAALENCVAYVDSMGLFNFGPMKMPGEGIPPVMTLLEPPTGTQLVMGVNIIRLRASVGAAESVPAVTVTGYDPKMAMPVMGMAPTAEGSTSMSLDPATLPPVVAGEFEAMPFFDASYPIYDEGAAQTRAMSIAADIASALAEVEGQCVGNPAVVAGEVISLGMVGPPFDGQYVCSAARHVFEPEHGGYTTWFTVGGRRDRSLYSLASGAGPGGQSSRPNVPGVVVGQVINNLDPDNGGKVQVRFPWLGASYTSPFARTVQMGASALGGCLWLPEVGDEVLVAFDRGDMNSPYVIGNLYNGMNTPQPTPDIGACVGSRRLTSRGLNQIKFNDGPEAVGIEIQTGTQTCKITMDDDQQSITIEASGGQVNISGATGLSLQSDIGNISLQAAAGSVSISGTQGVSIEASGGQASITAPSGFSVDAGTVELSAASISLGA